LIDLFGPILTLLISKSTPKKILLVTKIGKTKLYK